MQLYIYISIAVVLISTATLLFIFHRNHMVDLRYRIGLALSALVACAGSLLFPGLLSIFSENTALRFFIVFFLTLLLYILVLFIAMILVFQIVSKEKVDSFIQKLEEKKQKRKDTRELKLKEKEEKAAQSNVGLVSNPQQVVSTEAVLMPDENSINKTDADIIERITPDIVDKEKQTANSAGDMLADERSKENVQGQVENSEEAADAPDTDDQMERTINLADDLKIDENFTVNVQDNVESSEKVVDTPDIIDKMGIDEVTDSVQPAPEQDSSLETLIKQAFLLKQQGNAMEAAVLYMAALDQKPDNETAFWIVLDICAIYKSTGHQDLAEDILMSYIDAFEHLMSEEVKDQILQSLFDH
ncbi:MAG: hypothetical protein KBA53_02155 [Thermoclostridium sp.]|nr:hypothetical protein [Thermoclostridium sp.]